MKKIKLSRHVVLTDENGVQTTIPAGEHTLAAAVVAKLETVAKGDARITVKLIEDLTPKEARELGKREAAKAESNSVENAGVK